jgi:hypothetical protein
MPEQPIDFDTGSNVSPTGEPRMSPARVPMYLVLAIAAAAGFTAAGQLLPERFELARIICTILGVAIGAGLGVASPGLRRGGTLLVLFAVGLSLQGCVPSLHQHPGPIGKPGPAACYAASEARRAWLTYVEPYVRAVLEAQEAHSCQPVPVPPPPAP